MSLAGYLAERYGNQVKDKKKKEKKKEKKAKRGRDGGGDDDNGAHALVPAGFELAEEDDEEASVSVSNKVLSATKGWKRVGDDAIVEREVESVSVEPINEHQTVYRDSSGKIIQDYAQELQRRAIEQNEQELAKKSAVKRENAGLVQQIEASQQRSKLESLKDQPLHVTAEDSGLNAEQRQEIHRADPALMFDKSTSERFGSGSRTVSRTGRKLYSGSFAENRFGIRPGYRWDGVDRSTGFEKLWFEAQAVERERRVLEYTMQEEY
ncbi:unnamed protein product [Kuraishia capsulata CBS 1993]|uniref:Pre-mRNA-splicing factor CWC26 n=1 Tax=Kuraishia capsulata CBS 1993 TaxID=1382522 RepID=W6MSH3_9ASCO|nr:uncharacterized protein KUCA_T00004143001 [Kuraishia capsulata CBS 1993]CDK28162.1 unnamed protein product [Kuraishia capsulata CBS 1993]